MNRPVRKRIVCLPPLVLAASLLFISNAPGAEPARLAIVAENAGLNATADLLTAALSTDRDLILLERQQIERVFREQQLSAANRDYLKLGQLLGADGLLWLGLSSDSKQLEARLIAVKPGVVLSDDHFGWPLSNPSQWSKGFADHISPFYPKLTVLAKDAVPISVLNVRSTLNTEGERVLEKELTLLLIHRLTREKEVFVLERRHLADVLFEKELQPRDESPFWTGRYLLEGTLDRNGFDPVTATISVRLVAPQGGEATNIEISGPRDDPAKLVESLTAKVLSALNRKGAAGDWQPALEADQYFREARWAQHWGLVPESLGAIESAWALGKRTKDAGILRIEQYLVRSGVKDASTLDYPPENCDVALEGFPDVLHGMRLYLEERRFMMGTNGSDFEWYDLGLTLLSTSGKLLQYFANEFELRPQVGTQLVEARELSREILSFLNIAGPPGGWYKGNTLASISWENASVWFEQPEGALAVCRKLVNAGFHPGTSPPLIGWSWPDRRRIPSLQRNFAAELSRSTNDAVQLEGMFLTLALTPFDADGRLDEMERKFRQLLWDRRHQMYNGGMDPKIGDRVAAVLAEKHGFPLGASYDSVPWRDLRERVQKDYWASATNYIWDAFQAFSPGWLWGRPDPNGISPALAQEWYPLLKGYRTRVPLHPTMVSRLDAALRDLQKVLPAPTAPAESVSTGEKPLPITFTPWKVTVPPADQGTVLNYRQTIERNGILWLRCGFSATPDNMQAAMKRHQRLFLRIDAKTASGETILFPEEEKDPDWFDVGRDSLFASVRDGIMRYRLKEKRWEKIPAPLTGAAQIAVMNGRVYAAFRESILELDPDSGAVQTLASIRRRPAVVPLDELEGFDNVVAWPEGQITTMVKERLFSYSPATQSWKEIPISVVPRIRSVDAGFSDAGFLVRVNAGGNNQRFYAIANNGSNHMELLLHQEYRPWFLDQPGRAPLAVAKWDWPEPQPLAFASVFLERDGVSALNPVSVDDTYIRERNSPIQFTDGRNATLIRFEEGSREGLCVPVQFQKDGKPLDPSHPYRYEGPQYPWPYQCVALPEGWCVITPGLVGHWFIPRKEIEPRLVSLRKTLRERGPVAGAPIDPAMTNWAPRPATNSTGVARP